jgi:hypothetical protein
MQHTGRGEKTDSTLKHHIAQLARDTIFGKKLQDRGERDEKKLMEGERPSIARRGSR